MAEDKSNPNVLSYVLLMREKLNKMNTQAQVKQDLDRRPGMTGMPGKEPGDQVLILLLTATSKLQAHAVAG